MTYRVNQFRHPGVRRHRRSFESRRRTAFLERLEDRDLLAGLNLTIDSLIYASPAAAQAAWVAQEQSAPVTPATAILGQSALQMTANFSAVTPPGGATSERAYWERTFATPLDLSSYTGFEIAMYSADVSPITSFSISMGAGADDWYRLDIAPSQVGTTAWNTVVLDMKSAAVEDGGAPGVASGWNHIQRIRIAADALPTQTADATFYLRDLKATGQEQIDSFIYATPVEAQAQWVKVTSSAGLAFPATNIAGRDALAFPVNSATNPDYDRAVWDRTLDLDLSWARGFQFEIYSDNSAPISHITFYISTGTTWTNYCFADFYVVKPGVWNTVTIDLAALSVSGSPQWGKINVLRLSPWRAQQVDTTLYLSDMRVFGSRQIDSFEYATDADAQAAWTQSVPSSEGPVALAKNLQGGRALAMPVQFAGATSDPRFDASSWNRTLTLDLSCQRGVQLDVFPDSLASISGISLGLQSGSGWYERTIPAAQLVAGQWNTITITREEMIAQETPDSWAAITDVCFSVLRDKGVAGTDSTVYLRDFRTADPEILIIRQEDAGPTFSAAVARQFADAGIAFAGISTTEVRADRLDRAKLLVLPYNVNLPTSVTDALIASITGGRKFLGFGRLPWALYTAIGMTVGGYYSTADYSFASIRPVDSAALPGVPPIVYEAAPLALAANTIEGQSSVLAWWYNTSGDNTGIPAVVGSSNGMVMTNVLLTDDLENKKRLLVSMAGKLLPDTWASAALEAMDQIGRVGPYADFASATSGIAATATANHSTARTQSYLDSAAAERTSAQAAVAVGDDVAAMEAALQGRTSLRQAYSAAQNPEAGELRAFFCASPYGVPGQSWDTTIGQLAESGFNAVAVNLAGAGGAYYDTNIQAFSDGTMFPRVYDSRGDQLALLVAATQKYGVDLYVWKANWSLPSSKTPQWFTDRMRTEGRLQLDINNNESFSGDRWLDPAVPANQDLDVATMVELAGKPGVKGILLDTIRYPGITASFSPASNAAFQAYLQTNSLIGPTDTVVWPTGGAWASRTTLKVQHGGTQTAFLDDGTTYVYDAWITWRQGNITADVARISVEARATNPNIVITAAVAKNWVNEKYSMGQDWVSWLANNYIDSAVPMNYTSCNSQLDNWITNQQAWAPGGHIYPAIEASINPGDLVITPSDRTVDQILLTRQHNTGGFYVFNLGTTEVISTLPTLGLGTTLADTPPTISDIVDQITHQDVPTPAIAFTVGDAETLAESLTVSGVSSNTTLVPTENIVFGGSGANRTVTITPAPGQSGTATITVTVSDGSLTAGDTFVLAVNPPATYYVDATDGNDAWDGLSGAYSTDNHGPWKTILKVNQSTIQPGDSVLLQRGEAWREQLLPASGTAAGVITYADYGDPAQPKPLLLGSTERNLVADWENVGGNVWTTRSVWDSIVPDGAEMLANPSFDTGSTGWYLYAAAPASATGARDTAVYDTAPAGYRVSCAAGGTASSQIQLVASNPVSVTAGQWYQLSFRAKCTQAFTMPPLVLQKNGSPWTSYGTAYFNQPAITTDWATYEVLFQASTTAADARISFSLGGALPSGSNFYIDTLSLRHFQFSDSRPWPNVDVGNLIFNNGQSCGVKRWSLDTLQSQGDFWYDSSDWTVKLYSTDNPAAHYSDVELALSRALISQTQRSYVTYEDLDLRYSGADGIYAASTGHITVRGCDFGFLGGAESLYSPQVRYGNGITFWNNASDCLVECCTFHDIYDVALTNQGAVDQWSPTVTQSNIAYRNNVIWNCEFSFNAWLRGKGNTFFSHIYFENNTSFNAGGGWSHNQRPDPRGYHVVFWGNEAVVDNYYVRNNIFAESTNEAIRFWTPWSDQSALILDNNLYYESAGNLIVSPGATYTLEQFAAYQSDSGKDAHSLAGAPGLVNPGSFDFRLRADSPAIDAGANTAIATDFLGTPRPQGLAYDIGAYESGTILLSKTTATVGEPNTTDSFTAVLTAQPLSDVVFSVTSRDTTEVTASPATLTFTPSNWNLPQTVTLSGVDDPTIDGSKTSTVTVSVVDATSDDAWDGLADQTAIVTTTDNDLPGFALSKTSASVGEPNTTDTFTLVLTAQPLSDVVFSVSGSDTTEVTASPATVTFTPSNWNLPQTVTLAGVDDPTIDGAKVSTVTVSVLDAASDDAWDSLADQALIVTTSDNDLPGFALSKTTATVGEPNATDTFTVVLTAQPLTDVVFSVTSGDATEVTLAPATLTFTPSTWNLPQTVTLSGVDDPMVDGPQASTVTVSVLDAASDDAWDSLADQAVIVTTTDNDLPGFALSKTTAMVGEPNSTDTFTVVLTAQPLSDVVFFVTSGDTTEVTAAPATLTFTRSNWNLPQTVTLTGVDDLIVDGPQGTTVTLSVVDASSDDAWDSLAERSVTVTTTDNEINRLPVLLGVPAQDILPSLAPYRFNADATDPDLPAQTLTFSLVDAPAGATIDSATGEFVWTPAAAQSPQDYTFLVRVDDGLGYTQQAVTLRVSDADMPGFYVPGSAQFFLREAQAAGAAEHPFTFGMADWIPLVGDWNGDHTETVGVYEPSTGMVFLTNSHGGGSAEIAFQYGMGGLGWIPLTGDWDGDGRDTIGLYEPATGLFFLKNSHSSGDADVAFQYGMGNLGWTPVSGDWDGDGRDTVGLYEPATSLFFLKNSHSSGDADVAFQYGVGSLGWVLLSGDWDSDGRDTVGLYEPATSLFFLKNSHQSGPADHAFQFGIGGAGWRPLVGCWQGQAAHPSFAASAPAPTASASAAAIDQLDLAALAADQLQPSLSEDELDSLFGSLSSRRLRNAR